MIGERKHSSMSAAVQAAVIAARKRLEQKQKKAKTRDDQEVDMELDSDDEAAVAAKEAAAKKAAADDEESSDDSDQSKDSDAEERIEDRVFFHFDGRMAHRMVLPKGVAPAGAFAWQASRKVLLEKLAENGMTYIHIMRGLYNTARQKDGENPPPLNSGDVEHHFRKHQIDRVRFF
jgi:hypothetical protein